MLHPSQIGKNSVLVAQTRFMEDTDYAVEIEVSEASTGLITICITQVAPNGDPVMVKFFGPEVAAMREP